MTPEREQRLRRELAAELRRARHDIEWDRGRLHRAGDWLATRAQAEAWLRCDRDRLGILRDLAAILRGR